MFRKIGLAFMFVFLFVSLAIPAIVVGNTPTNVTLEAKCLAWDANPVNQGQTLIKTTIFWRPDSSVTQEDYNVGNSFDLTDMAVFIKCLDDPDILAAVGDYNNKIYALTITNDADCNSAVCTSAYSTEVTKLPFGPVPGALGATRLEQKSAPTP